MQRFWSFLAVGLGKHAVVVTLVGLLITVGLGLGITQLKFQTSQDSYLNKSDQVYKDNVAYQRLFGGQAMLTVITMEPGHTVDELFTPDGISAMRQFATSVVKFLNPCLVTIPVSSTRTPPRPRR